MSHDARPSPGRTVPFAGALAACADGSCWVLTVFGLTITRALLTESTHGAEWNLLLSNGTVSSVLCIVVMLGAGWVAGLYRLRYMVGSVNELQALALVALITSCVLAIASLIVPVFPKSILIATFPMALFLMGATRLVVRRYLERRSRPRTDAVPVLLYGAGFLGASVVRRMLSDPHSTYLPVGFIDDDPRKTRFALDGKRVLGSRGALARIIDRHRVQAVVVCISAADASFLRDLRDAVDPLGVRVLVFPSLDEALAPAFSAPQSLREVSVDDLVGRRPAEIDLSSVASYLSGRRVLVTGAGGSIGSELCRQIHKYGPRELIMLDRDESGLHGTQVSILGHGLLDTDDTVLADIRDGESLERLFRERRPEIVFHAAALKHLPMLERFPQEAWKTNVLGTLNVLRASLAADVACFVNISTDKAASPISVLGFSKRLAERLTAWAATQDTGTYVSVRFGNVIGSRGSVLPTFRSQIESGGPVTVTHPDVTRYFMTIPEACELVVQAGAIGQDGQVMILDMGEPIRILDVAQRMIDMSGREVEIVFAGLRDGEKLHEELFAEDNAVQRSDHPRISRANVPPIPPQRLDMESWLEHASRTGENRRNGRADSSVRDDGPAPRTKTEPARSGAGSRTVPSRSGESSTS